MRYKIVAVRDRTANVYSVPTFVASTGSAIRSFGDEIRRPHSEERPNPLALHPEDFDLFALGEYDDELGEFEAYRPQQIAIGKDYVLTSRN